MYNYPTMYWRRLADGTFQKMTSLRVYPWPREVKKIEDKHIVAQALRVEKYKKNHKTSEERVNK
jgi:hypothetical protein